MILGSLCCCESDCLPCQNKECNDKDYDYVFLICNSNSARDDEWQITLNGVDFGNVVELGIDRCQGKFFYTDIALLNFIKEDVFDPKSRNIKSGLYCGNVPLCCLRNTFTYVTPQEVSPSAFSYCGYGPFLKMTKTKLNYNGNYGNIFIWRRGFYFDSKKNKIYGKLCALENTIYYSYNEPIGYVREIYLNQPNPQVNI